ncbi:DUF6262 family protein [Rhodococcus sp. PAE-6]|uniref:DUF6262 family protein n=1 Tax=Rhodococcus sp. PAE-6 TaxID=2972477 RepID=UPI0021B36323|nr:DUF6262 family protein [Rhodococcus sp. PAE-6]MCT7294151.1 DUF6262 family protein [Rhodococcus sp. PAE-6]
MTTPTAIAGLIHYNTARSKQKTQAVLDAVAELRESPRGRINKSIVARHAGVSREFIYAHPDLRQLIDAAAQELPHNNRSTSSKNANIDGLHAQNQTFAAKISDQKSAMAHLRSTIQELQKQRQYYLGDALAHSTIDIGDHQRLQADYDRLAAENIALRQRSLQQDSLLAECREDLAASRRAHTEDIARNTFTDGAVPLHHRTV